MMKLAIYDLDGTLFNTVQVNYHAYKEALGEYGFSVNYEYFKKYCNGKYYKEFLPKIMGSNISGMDIVHERKKLLYRKYMDQAKPNENLLTMASMFKNEIHTAIVTTASKENAMQLLENYGVSTYFEKIFTREDFVKNKPEPEGFILAMDFFDVKSKETLIFEDSEVGIEAAKRSGADCCIVTGYN